MKMKQILLGTLFAMGTLTYAQGNKVIVPVDGTSKKAAATMNVEVTGKVFNKADKSMVIEIKSAASPDGTGFAFVMPDLFTNDAQGSKKLPGNFTVKILQNDQVQDMTSGTVAVNLLKGSLAAAEQTTNGSTQGLAGSANDVQLKYEVAGSKNTGNTQYDGSLLVTATPGSTAGSYSDTSVSLQVEYSEAK